MYQENKDMGYGQNVGQEAQQSTYMQYTHSKVLVRKDGTSGEQVTYLETSGTMYYKTYLLEKIQESHKVKNDNILVQSIRRFCD